MLSKRPLPVACSGCSCRLNQKKVKANEIHLVVNFRLLCESALK